MDRVHSPKIKRLPMREKDKNEVKEILILMEQPNPSPRQ